MAKKDKMVAPTNDPTAGKAVMASLVGAGAGALTGLPLAATAALIEAAAMRIVKATFFISIDQRILEK
ncbi:hypothetical protein LIER_24644 [Lithospermum erythrorhizon]|uniref:Uncharacterized protein n=1 Tax=Lithospermum erythrorhizon TaxID=34254 RepID=A0AAV3R220_LITER